MSGVLSISAMDICSILMNDRMMNYVCLLMQCLWTDEGI